MTVNRKKGIILVLILISLSLVGVIALALHNLVQVGTSVAKLEVINIRSRFVAQSGVDYAISNLISFAKKKYIPNVMENFTFFGEDTNANGLLEISEDTNNNSFLDTISCDINDTNFPSYARFLSIIKDRNQVKFVSGFLPSMFKTARGDAFVLKVVDTSSKIYIFDKNPQISKILKNLIQERLSIEISQEELDTMIKNLDGSIEKLEKKFDEYNLKSLLPFITFFGAPDTKVIEPQPYYKRSKKLQLNREVYSWNDYLPNNKINVVSRTAISINTSPKEIIYSTLLGISGTYIDDTKKKSVITIPDKFTSIKDFTQFLFKMPVIPKQKPSIGILKEITIDKISATYISDAIAKRRADILQSFNKGISANRPLFYNWEDFGNFLNELVINGVISVVQKDLILANVNPNTNLNKFNPSNFHYVDKTDLLNYTTEWTLGTSGIFEIESLSYILQTEGDADKIVAKGLAKQVVKIFDIIKDTTQDDFMRGNISIKDSLSKVPLAEIYPVSEQLKKIVPYWVDGYISMSRTSNLSIKKIAFTPTQKDYYLFVDGYYSALDSNFCFPIPLNIFNKSKWQWTLTFWMKPNFLFDNEVNPRVFGSFFKGDLAKLDISYFLLFFLPTRARNIFSQLNGTSPFLFYSYPSTESKHQWWMTDKNFIFYPNQWYFVAIVVDSVVSDTKWMTKIYINGKEAQKQFFFEYTGTQPGENTTKFSSSDNFCFGVPRGLEIWNFPAETTFDDITFFSTALKSRDIKRLFRNGRFIQSDDFVYTSQKFEINGKTIGTVFWDDNSTSQISVTGIDTYYSIISLQLFTDEKNLTDELNNSIDSPINKAAEMMYYKVKFNITKELADEYVLTDSPVLNEVIITVLPLRMKDMILTSFTPYEK